MRRYALLPLLLVFFLATPTSLSDQATGIGQVTFTMHGTLSGHAHFTDQSGCRWDDDVTINVTERTQFGILADPRMRMEKVLSHQNSMSASGSGKGTGDKWFCKEAWTYYVKPQTYPLNFFMNPYLGFKEGYGNVTLGEAFSADFGFDDLKANSSPSTGTILYAKQAVYRMLLDTELPGQERDAFLKQLEFSFKPYSKNVSVHRSADRTYQSHEYPSTAEMHIDFSLVAGAGVDVEVELVPPDGYEQWMPQADEDEKTLGNFIDVGIVAHAKGDPHKAPPVQVKKYRITLADTSKERGVDSNWPPRSRSTDDYDMKIDKDNPWIKLDDDKGQSAVTKQEDLTEFSVTVNSYDWGGYTKLKVVAELRDGSSVVAHVRGHSDQDTLSLPKDDNQNHIADWWEHYFDIKNADASADDDDTPAGDGHKGDSIALYDEYRGFHIHGKHERLSPELKDLFIWDVSELGAGIYGSATGVTTHLIYGLERNTQGKANNKNVVTPNGSHGDVYALYLVDLALEDGVVGDTEGATSVPRDIERVKINAALIRRAYGKAAGSALPSTIAHELGHATNVRHHGEKPPDYDTGDARCRQPDGSFKNYLCSAWPKDDKNRAVGLGDVAHNCYVVAAKGGSYSGNDQCFMRYDMADFYENPNGNCQWQYGGKTVHGYTYDADPPGMTMCWNGRGTGVNEPSDPNNKAGDASPGRGDCVHQLCLKNSAH